MRLTESNGPNNMIENYKKILLKKLIKKRKTICIVTVCLTVVLNICLLLMRTEKNHNLMLAANIVLDVICGWPVIYYWTVHISPWQKLYELMKKKSQKVCGTVDYASGETCCHMGLECVCVSVGERRLFRPVLLPAMERGEYAECEVVAGVILEVDNA